jgi:TPP-dependent 2-oxoacid decarboxylase
MNQVTVGSYLAQRLEEVGVRDYFAIPGDFNLSLLDELLKNPRLITQTNEKEKPHDLHGKRVCKAYRNPWFQ